MSWQLRNVALVILSIGIGISTTFGSPAALAAGSFELGVKAYNAGKFQTAVNLLTRASAANPYDARIHYYRANALVKLGRHKEAIREYGVAYSLDPGGDCASYCEAALEAYGLESPRQVAERTAVDTRSITASDINDARVRISLQAQEATGRLLRSGQQEAAFQQRLGDIQAQRIGDNAAAEIASIRSSVLLGVGFRRSRFGAQPFFFRQVGFTPGQSAQADLIRQQAASAQASARRTAQIQAQRAAEIAAEKARLLDETAANLQSQMLEASLPGSVTLNPVGTNLYVRNYGR